MEHELKRFRELTAEEKLSMIGSYLEKETIEFGRTVKGNVVWKDLPKPLDISGVNFISQLYYRRKVEKPSIDWSAVGSDYNYLAIDNSGLAYLYNQKPHPEKDFNSWRCEVKDRKTNEILVRDNLFSSFSAGTCSWEDSLISRYDDE